MSGRVALGKLSPVEGLQFADCERIVSSVAPEPPRRKCRDVWVPLKKQAPYVAVISFILVFLIFISTVQVPVPVEQEPTEDYYIDKDGHVIQKTEKDARPAHAPSLGYASPRAPAGWSDDLNLSNDPTVDDTRPHIAANGDTLHLVWRNEVELQYSRSMDGGDTWSAPIYLTSGALAIVLDIAVEGNNVHIVWNDWRGDNFEIYYLNSSDSGDTWVSEQILSDDNNADSKWPTLAVNGTNVHVAWGDYRHNGETCDGSNCDYEIYYVRSTDSGATWGANTRLTSADGTSSSPSLAVNGTDVHLSFHDYRVTGGTGSAELFYMNSSNNGDSWSQERMLTNTPTSSSGDSDIAVDGDNVHIAYFNGTSTLRNILCLNSTDGGKTWDEPMQLTFHSSNTIADAPAITVDGRNVSIAWQDNRNGNYEIYLRNSTDGGKTFNPELRLTTSSGNSGGPDLSLGSMHLAFHSNRAGDYEVFYKRSPTDDPVPIPEFSEIFLPIISIIAIGLIARRRRDKIRR